MKIRKIFGIFTSSLLTFISLYGIIPDSAAIKEFINNAFNAHGEIGFIITLAIIILCVITIIFLVYDLYQEGNVHSHKFGSKRFYRFFSNWYAKEGDLSIICDDIEWIVSENGNHMEILNTLIAKARRGNLYIFINPSKMEKKVAKQLALEGANMYAAPLPLVNAFSFSCLSQMGNNSVIIVRKKSDDDGRRIRSRDIKNIYVTQMLNTLIENMRECSTNGTKFSQ